MPGVVVAGRYRVVEVLGRGGQGSVVRAVDDELHRDVALKVIGDDELGHRARREGRALAAVRSAHVVGVFDVRDGAGRDEPALLVLEFVAGTSLRVILDERSITVDEVVAVGLGVLAGLEAAATAGVHHRDVKPDNIMVRTTDLAITSSSICLVDFGLAIGRGDPRRDSVVFAGSPAWLAPERASGDASLVDDAAADAYSLGVVLLEALLGANPFAAPTVAQTLLRHERDVPPPATVGRAPGEVDDALAATVAGLLDKDPARRLTVAGAHRALLARTSPTVPTPPLAGPTSATTSSKSHALAARRAAPALALVAGLALVVAALAWPAPPGAITTTTTVEAKPIERAPTAPAPTAASTPPPVDVVAPPAPPAQPPPAPTTTRTLAATMASTRPARVLPTPWPVGLAGRRRLLAAACADLPCAAAALVPVPDDLTALTAHKGSVDACLARCAER